MDGIILYTIIAFFKIIDNLISTAKTLFVQRNRALLAAISLVVSNLIYYSVIKTVSSTEGFATIAVVSVASGIGCYFAIKICDRLSKDRMFVNVLMSDSLELMKDFRDFLAVHHIKNVATDSYTLDWSKKTITITAYTETKAENRLIDEYIRENGLKIKRVIQKA